MSRRDTTTNRRGVGGPKTPDGRHTCSQNRRSHGCTSRQILIPGESEEEFNQLWDIWLERYQAQNEFDLNLIGNAVLADWRHQRSARALAQYEQKLYTGQPDITLWTDEQHKRLQLFRRYKAADENSYHRALRTIEALRRADKQAKLTNHRIAAHIMDDLLQPQNLQELKKLAQKALHRFPFPALNPEHASCTCPPCFTLATITAWRESQAAEPEPEPPTGPQPPQPEPDA